MRNQILRLLNAPLLVLLCGAALAIQTSLFYAYPWNYLQPDFVLVLTLWMALRRPLSEGGITTLIAAYFAETQSGAPRGLYLCSYMGVYLVARGADRLFMISGLASLVGFTLLCSILWKLVGLAILALMGVADHQWRHTLALLFPGAVVQALLALWLLPWLEKFDRATLRDPRSEETLDDELRLDEEGL